MSRLHIHPCVAMPVTVGEGVEFSSCFVYSPHGTDANSEYSRSICRRAKATDAEWLPRYVETVRDHCGPQGMLSGLFTEDTLVVPVPTYLRCTGRLLWGASCLASALHAAGVPGEVWRGLHRVSEVRKSSTAMGTAAGRPSVRVHYESFTAQKPKRPVGRIVLVDDVVSTGRTLLAAWIRLSEAFPEAQVQAFALIRTLGFVRTIPRLVMPCRGRIIWTGTDARRDP